MNDKINWLASTSIASGLLGGIFLALGHHFYYASLVGTLVEGDWSVAGYQFSDQQFNSAVGTAFSFAVRTFLMFSISTAYVQIVWQAAKHARKVNKLEEIDALFSAFSNVVAIRRVSVWRKYPLLLMIVLFGLFPVAFIVPPATLFVTVAVRNTSAPWNVPNFDFTSLRYLESIPRNLNLDQGVVPSGPEASDPPSLYIYNGPNEEVQGVVTAAASGGLILPITPPATNSSWKLEFYGPSIRCSQVEKALKLTFEQDIAEWLWNKSDPFTNSENCLKPQGYISWNFNNLSDSLEIPGPFSLIPIENGSQEHTKGLSSGIFIALLPDLFQISHARDVCSSEFDTSPSQPLGNLNSILLQCGLHNASYHTEFSYHSGIQSIAMQVNTLEALGTVSFVFGPDENERHCLQLTPISKIPEPCVFDASVLRALSYTAILDAFRKLVTGSISIDRFGFQLFSNTTILSTALYRTPDLTFIHTNHGVSGSLQSELQHANDSRGDTLEPNIGQPLPDAIEEMFHNITISLLSSKLLQPNLTSDFAPPKVNVSTTSYVVEYNYSARQLGVAYGIAVAVTIIAMFIGFLAIRSNGVSYTNDFSSIYRVAHQAVLSVAMRPEDTDGAYPLADYLGKAHLSLEGTN
ncbi:hypothetical protein GGR58DRAFT_521681 [Xylaria digitata]|nr:hypothetical protein GGR58DRAFT_521681 [Xylaria digitata]